MGAMKTIAGYVIAGVVMGSALAVGITANQVGKQQARIASLEQTVSGLTFQVQDLSRNAESGVWSYVLLGDVDMEGLQNLVADYEAQIREAIDVPLSELGLERPYRDAVVMWGLPEGYLSVHFYTPRALGAIGGTEVQPPTIKDVAKAAYGERPFEMGMAESVAKGIGPNIQRALSGLSEYGQMRARPDIFGNGTYLAPVAER